MDLYGFDNEFNLLGRIEYINLQWTRRYYEVGEFTVQITAEEYKPEMAYVKTAGRPECGIVLCVKGERTIQGTLVTLSGYFLERIYDYTYNWHVLLDGEKTLEEISQLMVLHANRGGLSPDHQGSGTETGHESPYDLVSGETDNPSCTITVDWDLKPNGEGLREALKNMEMSYRVRHEVDEKKQYIDIWQGKDRTQDNEDGNEPVLFTDEDPIVTKFTYTYDQSDYKDLCETMYGSDTMGNYYRHDGYGAYYFGDNGCFDGRRWILIKFAKDPPTSGSTPEMWDEEKSELQKHRPIEKADIVLADEDERYPAEYDLGDKCTIVSNEFQRSFNQRITEIKEVWKENRHLITLTFGEQLKTDYRRLKQFVETDRRTNRFMYTNPTT